MPDGVVDPGHGARKLLPAWQAHERKLWEHLPYISLWGDAILLRDGDLMASLAVDGINAELSEDQVIEGLRQAFTAVINAAGDDIAWYIHRVSVPVARPRPHRPATCFGSARRSVRSSRSWRSETLEEASSPCSRPTTRRCVTC